jgi:hypothetical protein
VAIALMVALPAVDKVMAPLYVVELAVGVEPSVV